MIKSHESSKPPKVGFSKRWLKLANLSWDDSRVNTSNENGNMTSDSTDIKKETSSILHTYIYMKYLYEMDKYLGKNLTKTHQMFNNSKLGKWFII